MEEAIIKLEAIIDGSFFFTGQPRHLTFFQDKLYFFAKDGERGHELWSFDGTSLAIIADINPGPDDSIRDNGGLLYEDLYPYRPVEYNNKLYLPADDGTMGMNCGPLMEPPLLLFLTST